MLFEENVNITAWIIVFIVYGAFFYFLDRWVGVSIYKWYYDMTHKTPLGADIEKGFLHNQKAKVRFVNACVLALFLSILNYYCSDKLNPLYAFLSWLIQVPLVFIGLCIGPVLYRLWCKKDKLFKTVDEIENGKIDVTKKIKDVAQSVKKDIFDKGSSVINDAIGSLGNQSNNQSNNQNKENSNEAVPNKIQEKGEEQVSKDDKIGEDIDPKELMNKYLNGRNNE